MLFTTGESAWNTGCQTMDFWCEYEAMISLLAFISSLRLITRMRSSDQGWQFVWQRWCHGESSHSLSWLYSSSSLGLLLARLKVSSFITRSGSQKFAARQLFPSRRGPSMSYVDSSSNLQEMIKPLQGWCLSWLIKNWVLTIKYVKRTQETYL